nr:hypothetical protein [Tanacetum cinerariifolium]
MLHNLSTSGKGRDVSRMSMNAFRTLCDILVRHGGLRPTQRMYVEEHVARFLHIVGNDLRNRFASWIYRRSKSTTSRSLHRVLRAIISLEDRFFINPPKGTASDSRIIKNALTRDDKLLIPEERYYLVDAGLPHKSTLMTPYRDRASGFASETAKEKNAREKKATENKKGGIKIETIEDIDELLATNEVTKSEKEDSNSKIMGSVREVADAIREGNVILHETNTILDRAYQRDYTGGEIHKELESLKLEPDVISSALIF